MSGRVGGGGDVDRAREAAAPECVDEASAGATAPAAGAAGAPAPARRAARSTGLAGGMLEAALAAATGALANAAAAAAAKGAEAAAPVAAPAPVAPAAPIGPGTRVLMIGDSQVVGAYGAEMSRLLRSTGASVEQYGSAGSSPSWWISGTATRSGWVERHADGSVDGPGANWRRRHATPQLDDLIRDERPEVLIVSMGGNMRGMSPEQVRSQVTRLAEVARESGTQLIWVGSPERRADDADAADYRRFVGILREAVAPYGRFIDSAPLSDYAGRDGVHYTGRTGVRHAQDWAQGVFREIQGEGSTPPPAPPP